MPQYPKKRVKRGWTIAQRIAHYSMPNETTGCIEWTGTRNDAGYGLLMLEKKFFRAHRLAWELARGPIPDGLFLCHRCDNPPCINPDHLFPGTHTDNMVDKAKKGRVKNAKLTPEAVKQIRASSEPTAVLAARFGVGRRAILHVRTGDFWAHV